MIYSTLVTSPLSVTKAASGRKHLGWLVVWFRGIQSTVLEREHWGVERRVLVPSSLSPFVQLGIPAHRWCHMFRWLLCLQLF